MAIRVHAESSHGTLRSLRLGGVYRVDVEIARTISAIPLQKALVVTCTSGFLHHAWNLHGETLAFDDDEQTAGGFVGVISTPISSPTSPSTRSGTGFVVVSVGPVVSSVATFTAA